MSDSPSPGSATPEARAGLGQLRETLASVRNLEQLLLSMHVGPRVLRSVVPDVHDACTPTAQRTAALIRYAATSGNFGQRLKKVEDFAAQAFWRLEAALNVAARTQLNAKPRLDLEDEVKVVAPQLTTLLDHLELVFESIWTEGMELPLEELLSSRPEHGSSRPFRSYAVYGPVRQVSLRLPPRVGVRTLALLAEAAGLTAPALVLHVYGTDKVRLDLMPASDPSLNELAPTLVAHVPVMGTLPPSTEVATAILERYGASFSAESGTSFEIPGRVTG